MGEIWSKRYAMIVATYRDVLVVGPIVRDLDLAKVGLEPFQRRRGVRRNQLLDSGPDSVLLLLLLLFGRRSWFPGFRQIAEPECGFGLRLPLRARPLLLLRLRVWVWVWVWVRLRLRLRLRLGLRLRLRLGLGLGLRLRLRFGSRSWFWGRSWSGKRL